MAEYIPTEKLPPIERRAVLIRICRVHLREARARREDRSFSATLLDWAGNTRRRAAAIDIRPAQADLFG